MSHSFTPDQCEQADDPDGPWHPTGGKPARYVRVKPDDWNTAFGISPATQAIADLKAFNALPIDQRNEAISSMMHVIEDEWD